MTPHCSGGRRPTATGALFAPPAERRPPADRPEPTDPAKPPPSTGEIAAAWSSLGGPGSARPSPDAGQVVRARPGSTGADLGGVPVPAGDAISAGPGQDGWGDESAWSDADEAVLGGLSSADLADGSPPAADETGHAWPGWADLGRGSSPCGVAGAGFLASADEPDRMARAALGYLADPGDVVLGALLRDCSAAQVV